jgi:hypothetical protein
MSQQDIVAQVNSVKQGGVWNDNNLEESLDWQGEEGSSKAAIDEDKTYTPQTRQELENEELAELNITPDQLIAISARVERTLLRTSGAENQTLIQMVDERMQKQRDEIEKWINKQSERLALIESTSDDASKSAIARLDEKIATLEFKIETLIGNSFKHGAEETRVIHEAYKLLLERKSSDTADDVSEPSQFQRMNSRLEALNEHMRALEPIADSGVDAVKTSVVQKSRARAKFGKMMG